VSFIQRAREAAEAAAESARTKATEAAGAASRTASDPATQEKFGQQARAAMGAARRGVSTVVERIDPGVLADLIIKATALQETTNRALRAKHSPYRINEISIAATIPPGVNFAIGRIDVELGRCAQAVPVLLRARKLQPKSAQTKKLLKRARACALRH